MFAIYDYFCSPKYSNTMKRYFLLFLLIVFSQKLHSQSLVINGYEAGMTIPYKMQNNTVACDTIFSFLTIDVMPAGITFDGNYLWNSGYGSSFIYKYDLNGQSIASIPNPGLFTSGGDMDFDGTNLLICVERDGILYKVNPLTGSVVSQFNLPVQDITDPDNFGVAFDGMNIWSTEYNTSTQNSSTLYKHSAATGSVIDSFILADEVLPIKFINGELYGISMFPQLLHKIDTVSGNYLSSIPWCIPGPRGLSLVNNNMWASSTNIPLGTQRIYEFDSLLLDIHEVNNSFNGQLQIYPNPASDEFTIACGESTINKIEIYNLLGEQVFQQQLRTLNFKLQTSPTACI
jgi:hypothetical protein